MIQMTLFFLLTLNTFLFLMMNHPLTLGLMLMTQTLLIALFTGSFTLMYWFSYSLFLIFMGGMLVLFMYMTSLASNESFTFSLNPKMLTIFLLLLMTMTISLMLMDWKNTMFNNKPTSKETFSLWTFNTLSETNYLMLNKMYNLPMNFITILLVNYLFLTLIATVKITNIFSGPLRTKTNFYE